MTAPSFCANCVEERHPLIPMKREGKTVHLCLACCDPLGEVHEQLRMHHLSDDGPAGHGPDYWRDGGRQRFHGPSDK